MSENLDDPSIALGGEFDPKLSHAFSSLLKSRLQDEPLFEQDQQLSEIEERHVPAVTIPATVGPATADHRIPASLSRAQLTDEGLFELVARERSEEAFRLLYDRYSPRVYAVLLHMLRTDEDAKDVLQEVFAQVWQKSPMYLENRGNVAAWILSLARNRAVDELRSKRYKIRGKETPLIISEEHPELQRIVAETSLPDKGLHTADQQREVRSAMLDLSQDHRAVIDLAYFGGLTHLEISEKLQMPIGTVKTKIRQAVMKLGKTLKPHFG